MSDPWSLRNIIVFFYWGPLPNSHCTEWEWVEFSLFFFLVFNWSQNIKWAIKGGINCWDGSDDGFCPPSNLFFFCICLCLCLCLCLSVRLLRLEIWWGGYENSFSLRWLWWQFIPADLTCIYVCLHGVVVFSLCLSLWGEGRFPLSISDPRFTHFLEDLGQRSFFLNNNSVS